MQLRATIFALLSIAALAGCKADKDAPKPNSLQGYWTLSRLECYCPPGTATPNEAIEFDANGNVTEYQNGQVVRTGTYQLSTGSTTCVTNARLIDFSWPNLSPASYTIINNQLIIDAGLCFDAPRKTYTYAPNRGQ